MKKKLIPLILALVCALSCMFGLAACSGDGGSEMIWLYVAKSGEQPDGPHIGYDLTYGQTPDLSDWKLYGFYGKDDNGKRDIRELSLTDEKLSIKYSAKTGFDTELKELSQLPNVWIKGYYTIEYVYDGNADLKATVAINVEYAKRADFTVQPLGGTTWQHLGATHNVIVKNPRGNTVVSTSDNDLAKTDDTDGYYDLYLFEKSVYDSFTQEQQKDYDYLYQYYVDNYNTENAKVFRYFHDENNVIGMPAGEYMLFALINRTCNYWFSVSSAVQITIHD